MSEGLEVKVDTKNLKVIENVLSFMAGRGCKLQPVMRKLGAAMVRTVDKNFEGQGRPTKWKKRSPVTEKTLGALGMIQTSYTKKYQNAKRMRTKIKYLREANLKARGNLILHDTGTLKKSITYEASDTTVKVGPASNVPYARIHQLGGIIRPKKKKSLIVPCGYGRVLRLKKVTIPARPYLVIPSSDMPKMARIVVDELKTEMYTRLFKGR